MISYIPLIFNTLLVRTFLYILHFIGSVTLKIFKISLFSANRHRYIKEPNGRFLQSSLGLWRIQVCDYVFIYIYLNAYLQIYILNIPVNYCGFVYIYVPLILIRIIYNDPHVTLDVNIFQPKTVPLVFAVSSPSTQLLGF